MAVAPLKNFRPFLNIFLDALEERYGTSPFKIGNSGSGTSTAGWRFRALTLGAEQPRLEVWYDRFVPTQLPSLWVGLHSAKWGQIVKHFDELSIEIEQRKILNDEKVSTKGGCDVATSDIPLSRFEKLFAESYKGTGSFAGRYFFGDLGDNSQRQQILRRALAFADMLLANYKNADDDFDAYQNMVGKEGRRRVVRHLRRERNSALAKAAKKRDNFTCRVCVSRLLERYKPFGDRVAEAHHMVALGASDEERQTTLDDLITVCPNCHRVLHTMSGKAGDWKKLAALYKRNSFQKGSR